MITKNKLRKEYRLKRKLLGKEQIEKLSSQISERLTGFLKERKHLQHIHIFLPIDRLHEINTYPLTTQLLASGKILYTSVSDHNSHAMTTVRLFENTELVEDQKGIPVPRTIIPVETSAIQMVLVPLLAFDLRGNRLGYGLGFYDRFLKELEQNVLKIGLSFFPPELFVPNESHDIPMDMCIFADGIKHFNSTK